MKGSSTVTQSGRYALKVSRPKPLVRIFYFIFLGKWKSRYESYEGMKRAVLLRRIANHLLTANKQIGRPVFAGAYDVKTVDGKPALIMDWIEGRTPSKCESKEFLALVEQILFEAGLPTWSVSTRNTLAWEDVRIVDGQMTCIDYESVLPNIFAIARSRQLDPVDFDLLAEAIDVADAQAYKNQVELEHLFEKLKILEGISV